MEEENQEIFTESHAKSILSTMNTLRKDGTLCDVTLRVQGQSFMAHRIVLAACSDYFCAMFTNEVSINPHVLNLKYIWVILPSQQIWDSLFQVYHKQSDLKKTQTKTSWNLHKKSNIAIILHTRNSTFKFTVFWSSFYKYALLWVDMFK